MQLCKARYGLGHHWGTFQLTNEAVDAPKQALDAVLNNKHSIKIGLLRFDPDRFGSFPHEIHRTTVS